MEIQLKPTCLMAYEIDKESTYPFFIGADFICYQMPLGFKEMPLHKNIEGECEILGTVDKGVIDFYCEEIMLEFKQDDSIGLTDFTDDSIILFCGEQSFISLLKSHSLSLDKKYLIIKPI